MTGTARDLIDEAAGMYPGEARLRVLREALRRVAADGGEDVEAEAVALAMLAQDDAEFLPEARRALERAAARAAELNWIRVHLAEATFAAGDFAGTLEHASQVQRAYFDEQDLHWRAVRMDELRAAAMLHLRMLDDGLPLALDVCAQLAFSPEEDDLSPPAQLAYTALALAADLGSPEARAAGCAVVQALWLSLDVEEWFSAGLVEKLRDGRKACEG